MPDPFECRGRKIRTREGRPDAHLQTLMFTSGSSGKPKAVAVGVGSFTEDIIGGGDSASRQLTVSFIPLSHGSDRYKMWEHVVMGGSVGFCFYAAENWSAHEHEKKGGMVQYASPVLGLFKQVRALQALNMALPPNIWSGLHELFLARVRQLVREGHGQIDADAKALAAVGAMFGAQMKALVTGGAPTPAPVMAFARGLCFSRGISFSESYGTTECGPVTVDRALGTGKKFNNHRVRIIDRPDKGFVNDWEDCCLRLPGNVDMYAHINSPKTGEVVVLTPTLTLGYYHDQARQDEVFIDVDLKCGRCVTL